MNNTPRKESLEIASAYGGAYTAFDVHGCALAIDALIQSQLNHQSAQLQQLGGRVAQLEALVKDGCGLLAWTKIPNDTDREALTGWMNRASAILRPAQEQATKH